MNDKKQLNELDVCIASIQQKAKELKACMDSTKSLPADVQSNIGAFADSIYSSMASLRKTMYDLHDSNASKFNNHLKNHAPAFKSNKHLDNFLKACDMQDDYEVVPKEVGVASYANMAYASTIKVDKKGMVVEVDFNKLKK